MTRACLRTLAGCAVLLGCGGTSNQGKAADAGAQGGRDAAGEGDGDRTGDGGHEEGDGDRSGDGDRGGDGDAGPNDPDGGGNPDGYLGAHCAPGVYVAGSSFFGSQGTNRAIECDKADYTAAGQAGVFADPEIAPRVWSIELASPLVANQPYASSIEVAFSGPNKTWQVELWGTNARCGVGETAHKLVTKAIEVGERVVCLEFTPTASYSHWLMVTRDVDDVDDGMRYMTTLQGATFCAAGSCQ